MFGTGARSLSARCWIFLNSCELFTHSFRYSLEVLSLVNFIIKPILIFLCPASHTCPLMCNSCTYLELWSIIAFFVCLLALCEKKDSRTDLLVCFLFGEQLSKIPSPLLEPLSHLSREAGSVMAISINAIIISAWPVWGSGSISRAHVFPIVWCGCGSWWWGFLSLCNPSYWAESVRCWSSHPTHGSAPGPTQRLLS